MKLSNKELFFVIFAAVAAWIFYKFYIRKKIDNSSESQPSPTPLPTQTQIPFSVNMVEVGKKIYAKNGGVKVLANEGGYKPGQNYNTWNFDGGDGLSSSKSQSWFFDKLNKAHANDAIDTRDGNNILYVTTSLGGFIGEVESIEIIHQKNGSLLLAKLKYDKPRYLIIGFVSNTTTTEVSDYLNNLYLS